MGVVEKIKGLGTKTLVVIACFLALATAATVGYLSSQAQTSANVKSPFEILFTQISQGSISTDQLTASFGDTYGGSTVEANATFENKANAAVYAATRMNCGDCDPTVKRKRYDWDGTQYNYVGTLTLPCDAGVYNVSSGTYAAGYKALYQLDITYPSTFFGPSVCNIQAFPS